MTDPDLVDGPLFHYLDSRGVAKVGGGEVPARYFVTQNAAVPRETLAAVGGFDERFHAWGFEDMELAFRLEDRLGMRFLAVTAPSPVHVHHHTLSEWLTKKRECGALSLPLLAELHPGRLREMRLHWVIDRPGAPVRPGWWPPCCGPGRDGPAPRLLAAMRRRLAHGDGPRPDRGEICTRDCWTCWSC